MPTNREVAERIVADYCHQFPHYNRAPATLSKAITAALDQAAAEATEQAAKAIDTERFSLSPGGEKERHFLSGMARAANIVRAQSPSPSASGDRETWRHVKRGTTYTIEDRVVRVQCETPLQDDETVLLYRDTATGHYCIRREAEFMDGRFERGDDRKGASHDG